MSTNPFRAHRRFEMAMLMNRVKLSSTPQTGDMRLIATIIYDDDAKTIRVERASVVKDLERSAERDSDKPNGSVIAHAERDPMSIL